jgi:hypothetical protein
MKKITFLLAFLLAATLGLAQEPKRPRPALPLTLSLFSESVSLPTFRGFLRNPNLGVRLGTELYYRNRPGAQLFQTVNLGYYHHGSLHHGLYVSTELGYRKFIGPVYVDGTIGGGYLHLVSRVPVYAPTGDGNFRKASPHLHKFMPTLGLGAGCRLGDYTSLFARYELFGQMPLANDIPVLPHKALHVGARLHFNK